MTNIFFENSDLTKQELEVEEINRKAFREQTIKNFRKQKNNSKTWCEPLNNDW